MHFHFEKLKDPSYFAENRLPAHSDHEAFASMEDLLSGNNRLRLSLNGYWKFFHARNEAQVIPGFEQPEYDCSSWADIPVPAHIQMEGYGTPQYNNVQYPWDGYHQIEPGEIPETFNPVACYVKTFELPELMRGMPVRVSFQGAESCVAVWLNGQYVGFSGDSFTPSDFDLTPYLRAGRNKLACRVYRWCAGSWAEDQDFMRFSGLFRDVYLYAIPQVHVEDLRVKTLLDDEYRDAELEVKCKVSAKDGWKLSFALTRGKTIVAKRDLEGAEAEACLHIPVENPAKWSSEAPNLYLLTITAAKPDGSVCEIVRQNVGFRRFELKNGVMCLNGQRIVFKGVNRHDFCAETGRAVTAEVIRRDLMTMKRNNINAVRTSHYPNHSALYALCDELGLYMIAENNMETHGVWDWISPRGEKPLEYALPGNRPEWLAPMLDRVESTYQRDKNHPSILLWSCGNESLGGEVPYAMSQRFRELDDTRLVHYECVNFDRRFNATSDIESQMYTSVAGIRAFLAEKRDKPFILCEYTHAMGNSNGAMHKYTEYAYEEMLYQGGFIWDYIDQSIRVTNRYGQTAYRYGGDFGERPHDGNFCGNGIVYGDGSESPKMPEVKYNYQNIAAEVDAQSARIHNRSLFTSTSAYECVATLQRDGVEVARAMIETDVAPGKSETVLLPFDTQTIGGEYAVTLSFRERHDTPWAPAGHEVAFAQGVYRVEGKKACDSPAPLRVVHGIHNVGVIGEHFSALFSKVHGRMESYCFGGREMLKTSPIPNFWRAPNDNDRGNGMPQRYAQWKLASMYATPMLTRELAQQNMKPQVSEREDGSISIAYIYGLPTTPQAACEVRYTVHPCGKVDVELSYDPVEGLGDMPEFGMLFRLDAQYDQVRYYGLGPEENYIDRCRGARLGIWKTSARENMAHYLRPQECGNRTGVRWADVADFRGRGLRFLGDAMEFSALPYTPHELENALHEDELPPIHNTIVRVMKQQMGVAGDDSWGSRTHPEYLIDASRKITFKFSFIGIV